jgi:undecaprenyl-diphosphatase
MNSTVLSDQSNLLITFLASFLIWFMFAGLITLWLIDGRIKKEQVLHALFSALLAWIISQMIKSLLPTLRPFEINGEPPLTITVPFDSGFPSGHTAASFGLATSIWLHNKKVGFVFILAAILVGWGRIISNVHYLGDVLAGIVLGVATTFLLRRLHLFKLL